MLILICLSCFQIVECFTLWYMFVSTFWLTSTLWMDLPGKEEFRESSSVVCGYRHAKATVKFIKHCTFTSYLKSLDSKIWLAKNLDVTDGKRLVPELWKIHSLTNQCTSPLMTSWRHFHGNTLVVIGQCDWWNMEYYAWYSSYLYEWFCNYMVSVIYKDTFYLMQSQHMPISTSVQNEKH